MDIEFNTPDQVRAGLQDRDPEVQRAAIMAHQENLNRVEEIPEVEDIPVIEETNEVIEQIPPIETVTEEVDIPPTEPEISESARYTAYLEQEIKNNKEKLNHESAETAKFRTESEENRRLFDEAKRKLDNSALTLNTSPETLPDEDDEFASDYEKKTRLELAQLKSRIDINRSNNPDVTELRRELKDIKDAQTRIDQIKKDNDAKKHQEKLTQTLYDDVSSFQNGYSQFTTPKPVRDLNEDFLRFRDQLATVYAIDPKDQEAVNVLESKYFKRFDNSNVFNKMTERGITPPEGTDILRDIIKYNDLKNGYQVDDMSGKKIPVTNSFGKQVSYGTIEEAYIIKNHSTLRADALNEASVEIQNKIINHRQSAVEVGNGNAAPITSVPPQEETEYYIRLQAHEIKKLSPNQLEAWANAYRSVHKTEPPKIPGIN